MRSTTKPIGLLNSKLEPLRPSINYSEGNEIEIYIAVKEEDKNYPRNWSLSSHQDCPFGGCSARIFASQDNGSLFSWYGPDIKYGDCGDYHDGAAKTKQIGKRLQKMAFTRGGCRDVAEEMGRFLEACGVKEIWRRPADHREKSSWLNDGDWETVSIPCFMMEVRALLYPTKQERDAVAMAAENILA